MPSYTNVPKTQARNEFGLRKHTTGAYVLQNSTDNAGFYRVAVRWFRSYDNACERVRIDRRQGLSVLAVPAADVVLVS